MTDQPKPQGDIETAEMPALDDGALEANPDARTWGMLAHLAPFSAVLIPLFGNFLGPLVVWLIKKEEHPFVDDQGKESLNFQIAVWVYCIACAITIIGLLLVPVIAVGAIVLQVMAAIAANKGERYRYPYIFRSIK